MSIHEQAILVSLSISGIDPYKYDREASHDAARAKHAQDGSFRASKLIFSKSHLAALNSTATAARGYHYSVTLPWTDEGWRLLPMAKFDEYCRAMNDYRDQYASAARDLLNVLDSVIIPEARQRLNGAFNAADYPTAAKLARKFAFGHSFRPIPDAGDVRVNIGDAERAAIQDRITRDADAAVKNAINDVWERLRETLQHIADRMNAINNGDGKKLHESMLANARELIDLIPALNVLGDPVMAAFADDIRAKILDVADIKSLRESSAARGAIAATAATMAQTAASAIQATEDRAALFAGVYG